MLEKNYLWRIYWRLAGVIMVCVVIALAVVSYYSHAVFDRELVPETEQKAATVGASVRALLLKATGYGIDFAQLYGVEQTFADVFEENPEFAYMAVTNTEGNVLYARVKGGAERARFLRSAYYHLSDRFESDDAGRFYVNLKGHRYPLGSAPAANT